MTKAEYESKWLNEVKAGLLKSFPRDFIENTEFEILELPQKSLTKGAEIFGEIEIIDTDGKTFYQSNNIYEIKYILYSSLNNQKKIKVVKEKSLMKKIVGEYEKHLDDIIKMMESDYKKCFPNEKDFVFISNRFFKLLNLTRF